MMAKRGIHTRRELSRMTGLAAWRVGEYVKGSVKRVDLKVLGSFCQALKCQPGDLFEEYES